MRNPGKWTDYASYLSTQCVLTNNATQSTNSTSSSKLRRRQEVIETSPDEMYLDSPFDVDPDADGPSRATSGTGSNSSTPANNVDPFDIGLTPLASGNSIRAYQLASPYDYVGVLYVGAYSSGQDFRDTINQGLDAMNSSGVTKLIIEVSGNGGGSVANGQFLQQTLFPDKYPGFPTETRAGQLAQDCASNLANGAVGTYNLFDYREYCKVRALF